MPYKFCITCKIWKPISNLRCRLCVRKRRGEEIKKTLIVSHIPKKIYLT